MTRRQVKWIRECLVFLFFLVVLNVLECHLAPSLPSWWPFSTRMSPVGPVERVVFGAAKLEGISRPVDMPAAFLRPLSCDLDFHPGLFQIVGRCPDRSSSLIEVEGGQVSQGKGRGGGHPSCGAERRLFLFPPPAPPPLKKQSKIKNPPRTFGSFWRFIFCGDPGARKSCAGKVLFSAGKPEWGRG